MSEDEPSSSCNFAQGSPGMGHPDGTLYIEKGEDRNNDGGNERHHHFREFRATPINSPEVRTLVRGM